MANKVKINPETAKLWSDAGHASEDYVLDLGANGGSGVVAVGAQGDLGAAPRSRRYKWRLTIDGFDTAPVVGEMVHLYLAYGRSTSDIDGDVGSSSGTGSINDLPNLHHIGTAIVQTTTAGDELFISGTVDIVDRYVSPVVYNATADALLSTSDVHEFELTPIPDEIQ